MYKGLVGFLEVPGDLNAIEINVIELGDWIPLKAQLHKMQKEGLKKIQYLKKKKSSHIMRKLNV